MKVTYLLGAGASALALPTIKKRDESNGIGLSTALKSFIITYKNVWPQKIINGETTIVSETKAIMDKLYAIAEECERFGTPDLYAKYLYESTPGIDFIEEYKLLKLLLSNYFHHEQHGDLISDANLHSKFDRRALVFLSTISRDGKLPENVKVISWNYDAQIEIANERLHRNGDYILRAWPNQDENYTEGNYFLMHLNGLAGWDYSHIVKPMPRSFETYKDFGKQRNTMLSFAWESKERENYQIFFEQRETVLNKMVTGTDILVIVGYSFPFFNRKIDKLILQSLKTDSQIIYQDPDAKNKIPLIKKLFNISQEIYPIEYTDQYYIPYEL